MSSNVVKSSRVVLREDETRVIDTNELIACKLEQIKQLMEESKAEERADGFIEGLDARQVELMLSEEESVDTSLYEQNAQELISQAREEANAIKEQALAEAASMKQDIFNEAKQNGYQSGWEQGLSQAKEECETMKRELLQKEKRLQADYEQKLEEMEPLLVDTLAGIYEQIIHVNMDVYKDVITYLIENTLHSIEGNRNFIIHISKEDYVYVSMNKQQIMSNLMGNTSMELVEDLLLGKGECMIETDGGIFDCGIDTQLEGLGKQLRMLSYEK